MTCIFIGFARLPVGDAATIIFCSPIFVMVFSHVLLREHCGIYRFYVIGLLLAGVVLIAKPPALVRFLAPHDNTLNKQVLVSKINFTNLFSPTRNKKTKY